MHLTMSRLISGRGRRDRKQHVRLMLGVASHRTVAPGYVPAASPILPDDRPFLSTLC